MSKQEETFSINDELIDQEVQAPAKSNKIKYAIAIIIGIVITAAISVLLVGHFKFNWFKSETYKINANISRANFQANYFSEKKDINVKVSFSNGEIADKKALISTNFVVILTSREKLDKGDYLNTASLVILDSNIKTEDVESELIKFKIFDEDTIKEIETNPNGSKYPMSIFTFHEDGKLEDIKLPDNMDKYNADSIVELIKNVIPKLTRNRAEDISNGLEIKEKKNNQVKTIIEIQAPRTYETFKGSKYSKTIERDIEEDQITNIRVNSNAYFKTEEEENDLGLRDFFYDTHSEIISMVTKEEKETAELIQKIAGKFNFIPSEKLIENILEKERKAKEEKEKITELEEGDKSLRNLGFNINKDVTIPIKTITFLGQSISIKYRVAVSGGKAINQLIIDSSLGVARFGNDGITYECDKKWTGKIKIFQFNFPPFPAIYFAVYGGASLEFSVKFTTVQKTSLKMSLSGSVTVSAEVALGSDQFFKLSAGVEGTIIRASGSATISNSGVTKAYSIGGGKIVAYARGHLKVPIAGDITFLDAKHTLFEGW